MFVLRVRMTGDDGQIRTMMNLLEGMDGVHSVEEVADLMPHMDDPDSSSSGLSDELGPTVHEVEVEVSNRSTSAKVQEAMDALAYDLDMMVEFESVDNE
ncbi:hypothetical protein G7069_07085 [Lysobacter sp. HDW10]|uniref:hypothetical protein n=1 Tax=Lysobacter sp. HDW10 TaxID=2714936 RepID=UPI001407695B|nr:hypothetical protein [Lysobacter sp. HDW10]QIK81383.1 hypothetical protein G7069_07085 [Lysobacter sp. HDW10]